MKLSLIPWKLVKVMKQEPISEVEFPNLWGIKDQM